MQGLIDGIWAIWFLGLVVAVLTALMAAGEHVYAIFSAEPADAYQGGANHPRWFFG